MLDYCINRLSAYTIFSEEEKSVFEDAIDKKIDYARGDHILSAGNEPQSIHVIYRGWASRYKLLANGREHIVAYLIPGDLCDVHVTLLKRMDHSIRAETAMTVGVINGQTIDLIMHRYPNLAKALFWSMMVDESIAREWLTNLAGRSADVRVAHLFCELLLRSRAARLTTDNAFYLPLNQSKIGEALGLSAVHTNRVIQGLRREGLIHFRQKTLEIRDWPGIKEFAGFEEDYLHMARG